VKRARKRSAAPFVNAVLRQLQKAATTSRESLPLDAEMSVESIASTFAHPQWLVERWAQAYGLDVAQHICRYDQTVPVTAIRVRRPDAEEKLQAEGIELKRGNLMAAARLVERGEITKSKTFLGAGCVVQDEASQLIAALAEGGSRVLDCCAAPGGKTLAIADRNPEAQITAVDLHPHRARLLRKLLRVGDKPWPNILVVAADARHLPFTGNFDRVLADVPCSGTGTLARNPEIKWRLKAEDLAHLQQRQLAILRSAMAQVAPGGRLIYSTCSLEKEENEDVVEQALANVKTFRILDCGAALDRLRRSGELVWNDPASLTRGPYLRTLPGVHPFDGFFAALLEKV
jgi:16S rRNA (cytosine967-C5)-methyltransferase